MSRSSTIDLPLMQNNITRDDTQAVIRFLETDPVLTNSARCRQFEEEWSRWLGVKYSVFVNSGSSANMLTMEVLREICGTGEVITPPLTWISDIVSVMRAGHKPVFCDVQMKNLCMQPQAILSSITPQTKAVFLTHVLGFNGLSTELLAGLKERKVMLIEDVCESHGATFQRQKLGSFGRISNFSFYYAHHLSTIEGGMVCTNDAKVYELARMYRSHGMSREASDATVRDNIASNHPDLRPEFIFPYPGYNFRSTEINAVIGLSQLPRLDAQNEVRRSNFKRFLDGLDSKRFITEFDLEGNSNYAFILILRDKDEALCQRLMQAMQEAKVEFRRGTAGGGNQLRQPYLKRALGEQNLAAFPNVDHVHFFGFYIGNFPSLDTGRIDALCSLLNGA